MSEKSERAQLGGRSPLHEPLPSVIAVALGIPDILGHHVDRRMAAVLPHLEQIGVLASGLDEEPRSQGMAREQFGRIAGCGCGSLHHQRHALGAHRLLG